MANIGIIGYGYVGKAVEYGFRSRNRILINDKYQPSLPVSRVVASSDFIFICVPTPMTRNYTHIDLSIVEDVFTSLVREAKKAATKPVIVIKSTVIPGTTGRLAKTNNWPKTLFNPEFLTQANYLQDFVNADRIVIGGDQSGVRQQLVDLYRVSFPETPIFETDPASAEMVKYMANTYLATKVMFANEIWSLCQKLGIRYEEVKNMVVADKRIYDSHLDVTGEKGFGGKCFPKDIVALLGLAGSLGVKLPLLETAWKTNLKIRKIRDWEEIPGAVSQK